MTRNNRLLYLFMSIAAVFCIVLFMMRFLPESSIQETRPVKTTQDNSVNKSQNLAHAISGLITPTILEESLESSIDASKTSDEIAVETDAVSEIDDQTTQPINDAEDAIAPPSINNSDLTIDQAIAIAIAKIAGSTFVSYELDNDDPPVYEILVRTNDHYYDVEILVKTGLVLDIEQEDDVNDDSSDDSSDDHTDDSPDDSPDDSSDDSTDDSTDESDD
ncbi:MAG: PepSY domain-containing protein [Eubacteriales bacterium]|nr:PepSY domain-containing protein [Eubacteriales bacterium]